MISNSLDSQALHAKKMQLQQKEQKLLEEKEFLNKIQQEIEFEKQKKIVQK